MCYDSEMPTEMKCNAKYDSPCDAIQTVPAALINSELRPSINAMLPFVVAMRKFDFPREQIGFLRVDCHHAQSGAVPVGWVKVVSCSTTISF